LHLDLPVGEAAHLGLAQRALEVLADAAGEGGGGGSPEDLGIARPGHGGPAGETDHPRPGEKGGTAEAAYPAPAVAGLARGPVLRSYWSRMIRSIRARMSVLSG